MEKFLEFSGITIVGLLSMAIALMIEVALLKFIFRCLAQVNPLTVAEIASKAEKPWTSSRMKDLRDAGL